MSSNMETLASYFSDPAQAVPNSGGAVGELPAPEQENTPPLMQDFGNVTGLIALTPSVSVITPISMMGVGLFGNIIALGIYHCSCSAHRNLPFYGIMKGLLWTNVIGYLSVYPLIIASYLNGLKWIGGMHTCNFQGLATLSFGMSTSLLVGCMGFERFLAVCKPKLHAKRVERRKIPYLIFLVWVFAVFTAFMPIVGFGEMVQHYPGTWCFVNWRHQQTVGKLYTSILAAELSGVLLLVFSCLVSVLCCTFFKLLCARNIDSGAGDMVEVTGTSVRRLSVRKHSRQPVVPGSASVWLTFHYVVFACTVLGCVIPLVIRIIINVSGYEEDHFATFLAMGFAECFPASAPWIYMLLHQQLWQRFLPCCFSRDLPNVPGGQYVDYCRAPGEAPAASADQNHVDGGGGGGSYGGYGAPGAGDHRARAVAAEDGRLMTASNANNNLPPHHLHHMEENNGFRTVTEDGTTLDILAIKSATRKSQQLPKYDHSDKSHSWKPLIESPDSINTRNNLSPPVQNHQLIGLTTETPGHHHHPSAGLLNQYCNDGSSSLSKVEYHALMRLMDDGSRENVSIGETSELAKACAFGKESTI